MNAKKPDSTFPVRIAGTVFAPDQEEMVPEKFLQVAIARIERSMAAVARQIDDRTKPVDEYQVTSDYLGVGVTTIEVLRQFDHFAERITSVLVTGPPSTAFNLKLGDRLLNLLTDATGTLVISPISMLLNYNDRRILTSSTSGNWSLELMGWADERY